MKVTVSCASRFWSFDLAAQLTRFGILNRLITSYPKTEAKKYGVPGNKIISILYWEIINRGWARFAALTGLSRAKLQYFICELFDKAAYSYISSDTDLYIGWSSNAERGLKRAKEIGAKTILERGSTHIEVQMELLTEEYNRYGRGKKVWMTHPAIIEKELREYELADYICVPSSFAKKSFIEKGFSPEKILNNPYGVNLESFKPGIKQDKVFRVIYVGQMSLRKGVHYLLEAFHSIQLENAELVLIGEMTAEIEPFFKEFKHSFTYLGRKPQAELNKYYTQSSVFVLCSIEDGMGMVISQAMACGLPVICTTNTAGEDLIENGKEGFVIPIRDIEAIKEKILWMHEHQEAARAMGIAARNKISTGLSWDDYGNRYYENIQKITGI